MGSSKPTVLLVFSEFSVPSCGVGVTLLSSLPLVVKSSSSLSPDAADAADANDDDSGAYFLCVELDARNDGFS